MLDDVGRAVQVDAEHLLVRRRELRVDAETAVVALEHEELVVVERHQRRDAAALRAPSIR